MIRIASALYTDLSVITQLSTYCFHGLSLLVFVKAGFKLQHVQMDPGSIGLTMMSTGN